MSELARKFQRDLNAGLVALVLLGVLAESDEDLYGYDIAKRLQRARDGDPLFKEGTIYPVLRSLAASGWLSSRIVPSSPVRRVATTESPKRVAPCSPNGVRCGARRGTLSINSPGRRL